MNTDGTQIMMIEEVKQSARELKEFAQNGERHAQKWLRLHKLICLWWGGYAGVCFVNAIFCGWSYLILVALGGVMFWLSFRELCHARKEITHFQTVALMAKGVIEARNEAQIECQVEQLEAAVHALEVER